MTFEEAALSLQLLAEERTGSSLRARDHEDDAKFERSKEFLRREQLEKL